MSIHGNHELHAETTCPHCGILFDFTILTDLTNTRAPRPGDFVICVHCDTTARFTDSLALRALTADEQEMVESTLVFKQAMARVAAQDIRHRAILDFLMDGGGNDR